MTEHSDGSLFLQAEEQAGRIAAELEKLAKTIHAYRAVADRLTESADGLGALTTEQQAATRALGQLTSELRRLAVEDTQRRLDNVTEAVAVISNSVGKLKVEIEQGQQAAATGLKQLDEGLRRGERLMWRVLLLVVVALLMLGQMFFRGPS